MPASALDTRTHDATRVLQLRRPEVRNALDTGLLAELLDAVVQAVDDSGVRVLVLTGAGGAFSAGADLREPLDHAGRMRRMELFCQVYEAVGTCPKVTIAAVDGPCVGAGLEVATACDLRVATPSASFRFPGAALGIPVGAAKVMGLVGLGTAKDLVLTSRTFGAEEAHRVGLVQRLVDDGDVLDAALAVARDIAANDPDAVGYLKRQLMRFSGAADRVAVENDALRGFTEAGDDFSVLTMTDPRRGKPGWDPPP